MKFKLFETSLLQTLINLHYVFPWVKRHYQNREARNRELGQRDCKVDQYQHYFVGPVSAIIACALNRIHWGVGLAFFLIVCFLHVVVKEVFVDASKRTNEAEKDAFKADFTLRLAGFVEWAWVLFL